MKKFFRHPSTIILIIIILIVLILALLGFRITYNPSLDNNWDAISACAAWAAVVVSGLAIYFAIQAPKKIAEEQNRIALFEKRYEAFQFFERCFTFYKALQKSKTVEDMRIGCLFFFETTDIETFELENIRNELFNFEYMLHKMQFLFPELTEEDLSDLYHALYEVVLAIAKNEDIEEKVSTYITTMCNFATKYNKAIWSKMYLEKSK